MEQTENVSGWDAVKIILRVGGYFRYFKKRIAAKLGLITFEHIVRLMILPWPIKIIIDHVLLGAPINVQESSFPKYLWPMMQPLQDMPPIQIMTWMTVFAVVTVALLGMTLNRTAGSSDFDSSAAVGSFGVASAVVVDGQDAATRTENQANWAESAMGGLLGLLEFKLHLRLSQSLSHVLRTQLANHVISLPMTTLDEQRIGDSLYRVVYDSTSATAIFHEIVHSIYASFLLLAITIGILQTTYSSVPEVIVVGLLVGPLTFLLVTPFAGFARRRNLASRVAGAKTTSKIEEGMNNILAIESLGASKQETQRFDEASSDSFKTFRGFLVAQIFVGIGGTFAFIVGQIAFFVVMSGHVIDGTYTAGDYFVVLYYFFVISAVSFGWGYTYAALQQHIAAMARFFHLLDTRAEKTIDTTDLPMMQHGLVMENVSLTYPDGRRALRNINLEARLREIVAFVGPTGAGKTTLAYLVPALLQASEGSVTIDGIDLRNVSVASLRQQVSYVFQETQLFSDTIFENIRYGNKDASLEEVQAVARAAGAHGFISELPDGYNTLLGTATSKLSVGQKQRISIARGLLRKSRILILDEPTSALDPETEGYLVDALHQAARDKLVIVIAHRLSTISRADTIHFLKDGEILESGPHHELMAKPNGHYRQFVRLQAGSG